MESLLQYGIATYAGVNRILEVINLQYSLEVIKEYPQEFTELEKNLPQRNYVKGSWHPRHRVHNSANHIFRDRYRFI